MFSSADLIDVLRRRRRRSIRPEAASEGFPEGWANWLSSIRARAGAVTGATAEAIVAVLAGRAPPPRPRPRIPRNRLAALASLAYPLWQPDPPDERGMRIAALSTTLLIQLCWMLLLFFFMQARFFDVAAPSQRGDEVVIQATFIGDGTPEDAAGGAPEEVVELPAPADAPATAPSPADTVAAAPSPPVPDDEVPAAQPLVVTETPRPDIAFQLPPPRPIDTAPTVAVREREIPAPAVQAVEVPERRAEVAPVAVPVPTLPDAQVEVRERAIVIARSEEVERRPVQLPAMPAPTPRRDAPEVAVTPREIPLRTSPAPAADTSQPAPAPSPSPASGTAGTRPQAPASGQGAQPATPAGAAPSTRAADDWGDAAQARDGGQPGSASGLLDAEGRPRLAGGGRVGGGLPPGTITEDFEKIDRMGTWLRRPPTDYQPTSFDRFWVPSETLLEEWVRRSIKTVLIPIPGTSKTIQCNVALLAFGGGCGISDPNMQDVETDGRPPPDVPWKPELQEDQDSLGG
ncbi:hypothetical protein LDO26_00315 [Luteimonas sp. BDR2-5]|uniref:hypothetical protein n=1 Tax=Proluteimonas luteida TaxID=2878685 RepID=UPI001E2988CF|nr:hypothetical protein [Luteimonas sp. BDR2-5]MCD9026657.1 hypothetical protein [Luteimonas sp. BDR2-5]